MAPDVEFPGESAAPRNDVANLSDRGRREERPPEPAAYDTRAEQQAREMQTIVANAVRHTTTQVTAAAVVNGTVTARSTRPSRSAAVAARQLASAAIKNDDAAAHERRSRSPSSSLSPLPATPSPPPPAAAAAARLDSADERMGDTTDGGSVQVTPAKRGASSPVGTTEGETTAGDGDSAEDADVKKPAPKKKRTRKPKEPEVYVIPDVERLETTFK